MNIVAITQARVGSSRLPAKVLKEINGKSLLEIHLERVRQSERITKLVVATTTEPDACKIEEIANRLKIEVYRGSVDDVLDRFYQTAKRYDADYVVRITSDCPLLDANLIDDVIQFALAQQVDYASNVLKPAFPDGLDVEVFRFSALEKAWKEANLQSEREHVTAYIWKNSSYNHQALFSSANFNCDIDFGKIRLTVDEQDDLDTIVKLIGALGINASWRDYAHYYLHKGLGMNNSGITRNSGYLNSLLNDNEDGKSI